MPVPIPMVDSSSVDGDPADSIQDPTPRLPVRWVGNRGDRPHPACGQPQSEGRTLAWRARRLDRPAVRLDQMPGDRQAESAAAGRPAPGGIRTIEAVEHM